ncbi:hypothetical protein DICVIV_06323 [Dictyocaulus viviparus]|uniref:Neurotransmitter-gated ion-channel ligand-binding domain-containing protein n=1 Tax=Dictyocaulus viviparus TaxID=29172 RepID=A0A0D8XUR2_DICVI|nr:hypothetical protein DICVIV_06323 [Dictyocaulus viviparus]
MYDLQMPRNEAKKLCVCEQKREGIEVDKREKDGMNRTLHCHTCNGRMRKTVLWINASYKADDFKLNVSSLPECQAWKEYWNSEANEENEKIVNVSETEDFSIIKSTKYLKESELIDDVNRLKELGLSEDLLEDFKAVGLYYKEICGEHGRVLWFKDTMDAKKIGITETSMICEPFKLCNGSIIVYMLEESKKAIANSKLKFSVLAKYSCKWTVPIRSILLQFTPVLTFRYASEELTPDLETLIALARTLNDLVQNFTLGIHHEYLSDKQDGTTLPTISKDEDTEAIVVPINVQEAEHDIPFIVEEGVKHNEIADVENWQTSTAEPTTAYLEAEVSTTRVWKDNNRLESYYDENMVYDGQKLKYARTRVTRMRRSISSTEEDIEKKSDKQSRNSDEDYEWLFDVNPSTSEPKEKSYDSEESTSENTTEFRWINIEQKEEGHPTLFFTSMEAVNALALKIPTDAFERFEKLTLRRKTAGVEIEGPIGVNISALEAAGVNLTELAEKLRNDTEVDDILSRTNSFTKTLGGSFILPVLNKNQYDPFSAPIVFQGSAVVVRFGIYIESMSNFQTSTMDYDMDIYLMMSWRDARLVNPYDKPILVKEEEILEKIWRPDPFFANAKEAEFHEVTFLNFLMRIFPDGLSAMNIF